MVARKAPSGPLDLLQFADHPRTAVKDILDDPADVDPQLWVDCEFEASPSSLRGGEHPQGTSDVGLKISHARLIGYCKGMPRDKGWRIYDINYPIPTITRFGNILIRQDGRVRYLSIGEMARASSFAPEQVRQLENLTLKCGHADIALKYIANAVPRKMLHTMYTAAVFDLQRGININDKHELNVTVALPVEPHSSHYKHSPDKSEVFLRSLVPAESTSEPADSIADYFQLHMADTFYQPDLNAISTIAKRQFLGFKSLSAHF